ncbi:Basic-leucine zipper transcription factor [Melia azedarach]|uniref:Basic-leucine zipper transcription factor n=1 Tax=Melia azedarach TaxID=155640 RepID=A0ACC1WRI5_MELAZ|nr:Basic-leucine zipper transcription factor [Melia azedarach]
MFFEEAGGVQFHWPVPETGFTASEIQEVLSLLQSEDSVGQNSGSEDRAVYTVDERKQRRMISNRESARRSRWRKKRHLENLTEQVNRLRAENRELKNRLNIVLNQCNVVGRENDRLTTEYVALWTRLADLYQIIGAMQ